MAHNITIKDAAAANKVIKTTEDGFSVHTKHVNVDICALPSGAATAANQTSANTKLDSIVTELQNAVAELQAINQTDQVSNSGVDTVDTENTTPAAAGSAGAVTAAPSSGKHIVLDYAIFTEEGTAVAPPGVGDFILVELLEETSLLVLAAEYREITVLGLLPERTMTFKFDKGLKVPTADKKVYARFTVLSSTGATAAKDVEGTLSIFYHEED